VPPAPPELTVIAKAYQLLQWSTDRIALFPRWHRYTMGARLEQQVYGVLERPLRAKYTRDRAPLLRAVNLELEVLRFQFRLVKDFRCLSLDSYGYAARTVNEIGQMVGGWLKKSSGAEA
jgi:hypothetical protein